MTLLRDNDPARRARARMRRANDAYSAAARRSLRGDVGAALEAAKALQEVSDARAELAKLQQ